MIRLKSLLLEMDWDNDYPHLQKWERPRSISSELQYAYAIHDQNFDWHNKLGNKLEITDKDVQGDVARMKSLAAAVKDTLKQAAKLKIISSARLADGTRLVDKELRKFDGLLKFLETPKVKKYGPGYEPIGQNDASLSRLHGLLDYVARHRNQKVTKEEYPDPGWSDAMADTDQDASKDKDDNTAWYEALNQAKSAIQELGSHIEALRKVENVSPEQQTALELDQIVLTMQECQEKLQRLVGDVKVFPHTTLFGEP